MRSMRKVDVVSTIMLCQDAVWCSSATFYKVYIVKGYMLSLLFIWLVLTGKSFDKNKIRQQQDFKYDALPPFWQQGRGQKTNKGKTLIHVFHIFCHM